MNFCLKTGAWQSNTIRMTLLDCHLIVFSTRFLRCVKSRLYIRHITKRPVTLYRIASERSDFYIGLGCCLHYTTVIQYVPRSKNHSALLVIRKVIRYVPYRKKPSVNSESGTLCVSICMFLKYYCIVLDFIMLYIGPVHLHYQLYLLFLTKTQTKQTVASERAMFMFKIFVNLNRSFTEQWPGEALYNNFSYNS